MKGKPALHGLGWLSARNGGLAFVAAPDDAAISSPAELGEGRYELHWFATSSNAGSFVKGVAAAGRNAVTATAGEGAVDSAVLVHRADEEPLPASDLDEAVPLVVHSSPSSRRAYLRWKVHEASVMALARSRSSSIKPVHVTEMSEDRLRVRSTYQNWFHYPDPEIRTAGDMHLSVETVGGRDAIVLAKNAFPLSRTFSQGFAESFSAIVTAAGGSQTDEQVSFPVRQSLADELERLWRAFASMWKLEIEAEKAFSRQKVRTDPENVRIARALSRGATLSEKGVLSMPDGRVRTIPRLRIGDMVSVGMIDDPFPPPACGEFRI